MKAGAMWFFSVGLALGALACASSTQPAAPAAAEVQPKAGGQFNAMINDDFLDNFDPTLSSSFGPDPIRAKVQEHLLTLKTGPTVGYAETILEPQLAERWEISPDGKAFTFHLHRGVKFQNVPPVNGRALTSADVKFSFEYAGRSQPGQFGQLPPSQTLWIFELLDRIDTPDSQTAVVRFKEPYMPFVTYTAIERGTPIVPREVFELQGDLARTLIGTGPFMLDSKNSLHGSRIVVTKNPGYWQEGKPYLDQVNYLVIKDAASAAAAFQSKQLDLISTSDLTAAKNIRQGASQASVAEVPQPPIHLYMYVLKPPFDNTLVRKAVSLALDRDEFIKTFTDGRGQWAAAGAMLDTFTQQELKQMLRFDPEEAKRLLAQAGYPSGIDLEVLLNATSGPAETARNTLLQAQLAKVGIRIALKPITSSEEFFRLVRRQPYDLSFRGKGLYVDVDSYLTEYHTDANGNPSSFNNGKVYDPELTRLINAQRAEADPAKRKELVRQAIRLVADKAWGLAAYWGVNSFFWQPHIKNYAPHEGVTILTDVWVDK